MDAIILVRMAEDVIIETVMVLHDQTVTILATPMRGVITEITITLLQDQVVVVRSLLTNNLSDNFTSKERYLIKHLSSNLLAFKFY